MNLYNLYCKFYKIIIHSLLILLSSVFICFLILLILWYINHYIETVELKNKLNDIIKGCENITDREVRNLAVLLTLPLKLILFQTDIDKIVQFIRDNYPTIKFCIIWICQFLLKFIDIYKREIIEGIVNPDLMSFKIVVKYFLHMAKIIIYCLALSPLIFYICWIVLKKIIIILLEKNRNKIKRRKIPFFKRFLYFIKKFF